MILKKKNNGFYSLDNILSKNAVYNMIIGERSNGKTYSVLEYAVKKYFENGEELAIVRRWQDDFKRNTATNMFEALVKDKKIEKFSKGRYTGVQYYRSKWYFTYIEEDKTVMSDKAFAYAFAITSMEHNKSSSFPNVNTILFDEFLTRSAYIPDEFVLFMNTISTIVRQRDNVKIFMLGNTVNKYCPYFEEMGLKHIKEMEQGKIDVYSYSNSKLKVAVEYCSPLDKKIKKSDFYFAFDNPKLQMITGGSWEIDIYPHCPIKILPKYILFIFFIKFDKDLLQCEIVHNSNYYFLYIHQKTTELKNTDKDIVYSNNYDGRYNWKVNILKPSTPLENKIKSFFVTNNVFYQNNEIGEIVRNYLQWCGKM